MLTDECSLLAGSASPTITTALAISQAGPWRVTCRAHRCQPRAARVWAACRRAGATRRPSSEISTGPMTSAVTTANSVTTTMPNAADRIDRLSTSSSVDSASSTVIPDHNTAVPVVRIAWRSASSTERPACVSSRTRWTRNIA